MAVRTLSQDKTWQESWILAGKGLESVRRLPVHELVAQAASVYAVIEQRSDWPVSCRAPCLPKLALQLKNLDIGST